VLDKHSSLFVWSISGKEKKVMTVVNVIKLFFFVTDTASK
jgi:hypothetical protein